MGSRMAARLLERGFALTAWDRDRANLDALVAKGAKAAEAPRGIVADAEVVITILWDDAVAEKVFLGELLPAARAGTTFIEMTTVTPAMQRRQAEACAARGCPYLGAPVTGSKDAAARGLLTALVGGDAQVLEQNREILEVMTTAIVHVGPPGASAGLKLANNQLIALLAAAWGESMKAAERAGAGRDVALRMFAGTFGRVAGMKVPSLLEGDYSPHFTVDALLKDIRQALQTAQDEGFDLPVLRAALPSYERAVASGDGSLDFSVVVDRIAAEAAQPVEARA